MSITIEVKPEVQAELSRQAADHGVDINAYAAILLEEATRVPVGARPLSQEELDDALREPCAVLAQDSFTSG
jgi:hypothetical protein